MLSPTFRDALAGRSAANWALELYQEAVQDAQAVLEQDSNYVFSKENAFDYRDLYIIIAQSAFALAEYAIAQNAVNNLDPSNGLDPNNEDTWIVSEVTYNTYQEALLKIIEKLEEMHGS